ncbi:hypothetical protein GCM10017044_02500 [Kordiimonas sediminis]|uniref:Glycosyltransferase family 1 protein n=1 Tax=Kordiimonas sediminis TaxID=1735581 RepID=A0A919E273_9PROT|nr:hypothetical protein [Kordiimonas sediminis]GHF12099.1 hypothetical protein GCM10017044_02500 [Kordiimonas sediminis]
MVGLELGGGTKKYSPYVIAADPLSGGWGPIVHLATLSARMLDAELLLSREPTIRLLKQTRKLRSLLSRKRIDDGRPALIIARSIGDVALLADIPDWRSSLGHVAVWIIDSFWHSSKMPHSVFRNFDQIYVSSRDDCAYFSALADCPVDVLPWGTDALDTGSAACEREKDLLCLGRMPAGWGKAETAREQLSNRGFQMEMPPPPPGKTGKGNGQSVTSERHIALMQSYCRSKISVAHNNVFAPSTYTHATREYMTARWTDALAAGCLVLGMPPWKDPEFAELYPEEGLIETPAATLEELAPVLRSELDALDPSLHMRLHRIALERFDWRHRLLKVADDMKIEAAPLKADLERLRCRVKELASA